MRVIRHQTIELWLDDEETFEYFENDSFHFIVDFVIAYAQGDDEVAKVSIQGRWVTKSGEKSLVRRHKMNLPLDRLPVNIRAKIDGHFSFHPRISEC